MSKPNPTVKYTASDNKNTNYTHASSTSVSSVLTEKMNNKNLRIEAPSQSSDSGFSSVPLNSFSVQQCNKSHIISEQQTLQDEPHSTTTANGSNLSDEHEVDSQQSRRFSNHSLQSETANNSNVSGRGSTVHTTATSNKPLDPTQIPGWQQFFQQNDDGDTYLHLACISGLNSVVDTAIRLAVNPCNLNIKNNCGQTALHLAALSSNPTILRMLLLAGADPNKRDRRGNTALHVACKLYDVQCVSVLTTPFSDAEINAAHQQYGHAPWILMNDYKIRNYNGEYCVHIAAEIGNIPILRALVQSGADINEREGKSGYTPLHLSILEDDNDLLHFLLNYCKPKLNLEATTFGRLTAYQLAGILKRSQMLRVLEEHGAEQLPPPVTDSESSDEESE